MVVQVSKCWATPTSNTKDVNEYVFIDNYAVPSEETNDVTIETNCQGKKAEFWFNSFSFNVPEVTGKTLEVKVYSDLIGTNNQIYV